MYNLLPKDRQRVMTLFMVQVMVVVVVVMLLVAFRVVRRIFYYLNDFYFVDHGRLRGVDVSAFIDETAAYRYMRSRVDLGNHARLRDVDVSAFVNETAANRYTRSRVDGAIKSRDELRDSSLLVYSTQTQRNHNALTALKEAYRVISSALIVQLQQIRNSQSALFQRILRESYKESKSGRSWLAKLISFWEWWAVTCCWTVTDKQQQQNGAYLVADNQVFEERPKSKSIKQSARVTRTSEKGQVATSTFTRYGRKVKPPDKFIA